MVCISKSAINYFFFSFFAVSYYWLPVSRAGKNPGFIKKKHVFFLGGFMGFFGFYWPFFGFYGLFWVLLGFFGFY